MAWLNPLLAPFDPLQLSGRYLGDYGSLNPSDIISVRSNLAPDNSIIDHMGCAETGRLQSLDLDFNDPLPPTSNIVEHALYPFSLAGMTTSTGNCDRFTGTGHDEHLQPFVCAGIIHDIPLAASTGIPGWKRIAMVQRCNTSPLHLDRQEYFEHPLDENCWTLEGLIVPGGHMIVGKYTNTMDLHDPDRLESGPFMFWRDWS